MSREGIEKAAKSMAYDNGAINRTRTEEEAMGEASKAVEGLGVDSKELDELDAWLLSLSEGDLSVMCAGTDDEIHLIMKREAAPDCTDRVLNAIFEAL